jgi:competence protein ComEA
MWKKLIAGALVLCSTALWAAVDINKATQADLESVKGIGPAMSTKILDERKKSTFKDWPDVIERIKGVGPGNAAKFSEAGLTVNGSAFASPVTAAKADVAAKVDKAAAPKK